MSTQPFIDNADAVPWHPDPAQGWRRDVLVVPLPGSKERHRQELRSLQRWLSLWYRRLSRNLEHVR